MKFLNNFENLILNIILALAIAPEVARDFSLMIQSIGKFIIRPNKHKINRDSSMETLKLNLWVIYLK